MTGKVRSTNTKSHDGNFTAEPANEKCLFIQSVKPSAKPPNVQSFQCIRAENILVFLDIIRCLE